MGRLDGKVAVVIGVGRTDEGPGNGSATAILFAREGAKVAVGSRNPEGVAQTIADIEKEGFEAFGVAGDFSTAAPAEELIRAAHQRWGRVDILHNNIGIGARGTVDEISEADWDYVWKSNVSSIVYAARVAVPIMRAQGGGSIINVSSVLAVRPRGGFSYTVTKAAELSMTEALASDHGPDGIRVNAVMLGLVASPVAMRAMADVREQRRLASALQTEGTVWDAAYAALFFASDESKWISGVTLPVDGGYLVAGAARTA